MNLSSEVGRCITGQGLLPHCIITDLTAPYWLNTVHRRLP
jgi:hypothetical protein